METETVKTVKHTPLPWTLKEYAKDGMVSIESRIPTEKQVAEEDCSIAGIWYGPSTTKSENIANAEFIVRACNSHYELLEALKKAHNFIDVFKNKMGRALPKYWNDAMSAGLIDMDEAIKKATS